MKILIPRKTCIKDVFDYVWGSTIAGAKLTPEKLSMQKSLVKLLIDNSKVDAPIVEGNSSAISSLTESQKALLNFEILQKQEENKFESVNTSMLSNELYNQSLMQEDVSGFGFLQRFGYQSPDVAHVYYGWLLQSKNILKKLVAKQNGDNKQEYQYLLLQINNALKIE